MTYRNRMKKPKRHLNPPKWVKVERLRDPEWISSLLGKTEHKSPYLRDHYCEMIDPVSGKYIGWHEVGYKERGLKKRHRQAGKALIAAELLDVSHDKCPVCGSDYCPNPLSCIDEEEQFIEFELEMQKLDELFYEEERRQQEEEYAEYADFDDYYYDDWIPDDHY